MAAFERETCLAMRWHVPRCWGAPFLSSASPKRFWADGELPKFWVGNSSELDLV